MNQLAAPSAMTPAPRAPAPTLAPGRRKARASRRPVAAMAERRIDRAPGHGLGPPVADEDALVEAAEPDGPRPEDEEDHRSPGQAGDVGREADGAAGDEVEDRAAGRGWP